MSAAVDPALAHSEEAHASQPGTQLLPLATRPEINQQSRFLTSLKVSINTSGDGVSEALYASV